MNRWTVAPFAAAVLALAAVVAMAERSDASSLTVAEAWSRPTPPGLNLGVVYLTITNTGQDGDALVAASTPAAGRVELHTHVQEDGVMKMRPVARIAVPARGTVTLAPGGDHLMLFDLPAPMTAGQRFPVTLSFETAGDVTVEATVLPMGAKSAL